MKKILIIILLFLSSCGIQSIKKSELEVRDQKIAIEIIHSQNIKNKSIKTIKGLGQAELINSEINKFRIAWSISNPDKLRLVILNIAGQPFETLSYDGDYLYILSHTNQHSFYKKDTTEANLEKLISIPIKVTEIIELLSGRIPIKKYNSIKVNRREDNTIISLNKSMYGLVQKIFLEKNLNIYRVEYFNFLGSLIYSVKFFGNEFFENINIPKKIEISTTKNFLKLDIKRIWTNVPVSKKMFVLTPVN